VSRLDRGEVLLLGLVVACLLLIIVLAVIRRL
jgi:hypothetical protein